MTDTLQDAPIGGKIVFHIPYTGSYLLTKIRPDEWKDDEFKNIFTSAEIEADFESTWEKYGDDWQGNATNWETIAKKYQEAIDRSIALLLENSGAAKMEILHILSEVRK